MKIALVIGHRSESQGAKSVKRISEYAYWYTWLHLAKHFFPDAHQYRVFERNDMDGRGYRERMRKLGKRIDEWGADIAISFHFNAAQNVKAEGFEVLCTTNTPSQLYARLMAGIMDEHLYGDNRGIKTVRRSDRGGGFLYGTRAVAILLEPFFGTNREDWQSGTERDGVFKALEMFFESI